MPKGRGANKGKAVQQQQRHIHKIVRGAMEKWDEENPEDALLLQRMAARRRRIGKGASMNDDDKKDKDEENPESPKPGPQEGPPQAEPPDDGAGSIPRDDA